MLLARFKALHRCFSAIPHNVQPFRRNGTFTMNIPTRWSDNDQYGHVNNVVAYSLFDTVINVFLIQQCGLRPLESPVIGLCVSSSSQYLKPLTFPDVVQASMMVEKLGCSSVTYGISLTSLAESTASSAIVEPAVTGSFVHVFVDAKTRKSVAIPEEIAEQFKLLLRGV
eukprot:m.272436 g.272436  ORF g.272436 m.272436 type:complete len:169 (-) comp57930_c0_seq1:9-515(-)